MIELSCHCGQIRLALAKRPDFIHACNCSLCTKTGTEWGYFDLAEVRVEGPTTIYRRQDKPDAGADIHFCATCGTTTHFTLGKAIVAKHGDTMLGVNMRLADEAELVGVEVRYPDGRAWDGAGAFGYVREGRVIGHKRL